MTAPTRFAAAIDALFDRTIVTFEDAHCVCYTRTQTRSAISQYGISWKIKPELGTFWYNDEAKRNARRAMAA
jgi:hypothetical protein